MYHHETKTCVNVNPLLVYNNPCGGNNNMWICMHFYIIP